ELRRKRDEPAERGDVAGRGHQAGDHHGERIVELVRDARHELAIGDVARDRDDADHAVVLPDRTEADGERADAAVRALAGALVFGGHTGLDDTVERVANSYLVLGG